MTRRRTAARGRIARIAALLGLALALVVLPATAASAHDYLVSSTPAAGSTVRSAPTTASLQFNEAVLDYGRGSTALFVTGPGGSGRHYETTCARIAGRTVSAHVALGRPGRYTVTWRVVSADGHPVSDSIAFTYAPPAGTAAAGGSARGPACGVGSLATQPAGAASTSAGSVPVLLIAIIALVALVVLAGIVVVVLRLTRIPADPEDPQPVEHEA